MFKLEVPKKYCQQDWENFLNATCYTYALNLLTNERLYIGDIYLKKRIATSCSDQEVISALIKEAEAIGYSISETTENEKVKKDELKICIVREDTVGYYHLYREEREGFWTHKKPMELPNNIGYDGKVIYNPKEAVEPGYDKIFYYKLKILNT